MRPGSAGGNEMRFDLCEVFMYNDAGEVTAGEIYYDMARITAQAGMAAATA